MTDPVQVLVIGDPHFKVNNVAESDEMTRKLVELVESAKPKFIVVLGDVLHKHEKIHVSPLMRAEKMIRLLSERAPVFLIIGNHDRPNNSTFMTDEHPFNAMKHWNNTYVVDQKVIDANIGNYRFLFVPYVYPGLFGSVLEDNEKGVENPYKNTSAIFCHQEFYGAKMGAIVSRDGDKWSLENPLVISGHIHDYDKLQPNLIYVGTPMQHGFGDKDDKTVSLFTFSLEGWKERRIDLGLIKRVIIYLDTDKVHTYEPPKDKLVKIVIRGDDGALKAISKLDKIKEWKKQNIKVCYKINRNNNSNSPGRKGVVLKLRYKDRLYNEVRKDKTQSSWFQKLF